MTVVSNTSPLCYLRLIEQIKVLPALFGTITIPESVRAELSDMGAPRSVREWIHHPPKWLSIVSVASKNDVMLHRLHRGEQDAIVLAEQLSADLVLLDEKAARSIASQRGLAVTGLIGLLDRAAALGIIELAPTLRRLNKTTFHINPRLLKKILAKHYP